MCGRYTQMRSWAELVELYEITANLRPLNLPARYNAAPTDVLPVVRLARDLPERELVTLRWGLVPFWAKDLSAGAKAINARAETVATAASFRSAFRERRCLVVADGFFEWLKRPDGRKQPYRVTRAGDALFAFAGLWESWKSPEGERTQTFTIIVTDANAALRPIHARMPVILEPQQFGAWLDTSRPLAEAQALLVPYAGQLTLQPVSSAVNSVRIDDASCIAPLAEDDTAADEANDSARPLAGNDETPTAPELPLAAPRQRRR